MVGAEHGVIPSGKVEENVGGWGAFQEEVGEEDLFEDLVPLQLFLTTSVLHSFLQVGGAVHALSISVVLENVVSLLLALSNHPQIIQPHGVCADPMLSSQKKLRVRLPSSLL